MPDPLFFECTLSFHRCLISLFYTVTVPSRASLPLPHFKTGLRGAVTTPLTTARAQSRPLPCARAFLCQHCSPLHPTFPLVGDCSALPSKGEHLALQGEPLKPVAAVLATGPSALNGGARAVLSDMEAAGDCGAPESWKCDGGSTFLISFNLN